MVCFVAFSHSLQDDSTRSVNFSVDAVNSYAQIIFTDMIYRDCQQCEWH